MSDTTESQEPTKEPDEGSEAKQQFPTDEDLASWGM